MRSYIHLYTSADISFGDNNNVLSVEGGRPGKERRLTTAQRNCPSHIFVHIYIGIKGNALPVLQGSSFFFFLN